MVQMKGTLTQTLKHRREGVYEVVPREEVVNQADGNQERLKNLKKYLKLTFLLMDKVNLLKI